jgi:IS30 family transposase
MPGVRLTEHDRTVIERAYRVGLPQRTIAQLVGKHPSTISRELRRCRPRMNGSTSPRSWINRGNGLGYRGRYSARVAHLHAVRQAYRVKPCKLDYGPLRNKVWELLRQDWSPEQIAAMLPQLYPDDQRMRVSHETIYRALFVQTKGELKRELTQHLRTSRTTRRPHDGGARRNTLGITEDITIRARPAEVEDRAVPGHWEGDLLMGGQGLGAVITLVERSSRFVLLAPLPRLHTADEAHASLKELVATLPTNLKRSITWDRGSEMARHATFKIETGIQIYFCDPHSPWQRGTNENTNGLLRQYLPKGTDMRQLTPERCDEIATRLNTRPRKTLDWQTPAQAFQQSLVATAG